MMEMTDAFGNKIFETIQITLVCGSKHASNPTVVRWRAHPRHLIACR